MLILKSEAEDQQRFGDRSDQSHISAEHVQVFAESQFLVNGK